MKSVAWILVFIISIITFKDVTSYLLFKTNQEYIANQLCVYRLTPEMLCYGSCVLKKALNKNSEDQQNLPNASNEDRQINLISSEIHSGSQLFLELGTSFPEYCNKYTFYYSASSFHPPKAS